MSKWFVIQEKQRDMANRRPNVPSPIKRLLIDESGGKCANPGCPNQLLELHHIREWHIYETHDAAHMIAVCAACHDHVDRGELQLSDVELYRWKGIDRTTPTSTHLFIEPGPPPLLILGSLAAQGDSGLVVFDFSGNHRLSFAVVDGDIMLLNVKVSTADGRPLLDVVEGYVRQRDPRLRLRHRPGRIQVPISLASPAIPGWARERLLSYEPLFGIQGLDLLGLHVLEPGVVKATGVWIGKDKGVVITDEAAYFLNRTREGPIALAGQGKNTVLHFNGPAEIALFGI